MLQGLFIVRAPNKVCYVIPVGTLNSTGGQIERMLQSNDGGDLQVQDEMDMSYQILPGEIEDVSFIPEGAQEKCNHGYQWMVIAEAGRFHRDGN